MKNIDRVNQMARGTQGYDSWRLRELTEEQANGAQTQLVEHEEALKVVGKLLAKGDIEGAVAGLQKVKERIDRTIESLK